MEDSLISHGRFAEIIWTFHKKVDTLQICRTDRCSDDNETEYVCSSGSLVSLHVKRPDPFIRYLRQLAAFAVI